jgi:hypothetical protein
MGKVVRLIALGIAGMVIWLIFHQIMYSERALLALVISSYLFGMLLEESEPKQVILPMLIPAIILASLETLL